MNRYADPSYFVSDTVLITSVYLVVQTRNLEMRTYTRGVIHKFNISIELEPNLF